MKMALGRFRCGSLSSSITVKKIKRTFSWKEVHDFEQLVLSGQVSERKTDRNSGSSVGKKRKHLVLENGFISIVCIEVSHTQPLYANRAE